MMFGGIVKGFKKGMLANEVLDLLRRNYRLAANPQGVIRYVEGLAEYYNAHELAAHYVAEEQLNNMSKADPDHIRAATKYARVALAAARGGAIKDSVANDFERALNRLGLSMHSSQG